MNSFLKGMTPKHIEVKKINSTILRFAKGSVNVDNCTCRGCGIDISKKTMKLIIIGINAVLECRECSHVNTDGIELIRKIHKWKMSNRKRSMKHDEPLMGTKHRAGTLNPSWILKTYGASTRQCSECGHITLLKDTVIYEGASSSYRCKGCNRYIPLSPSKMTGFRGDVDIIRYPGGSLPEKVLIDIFGNTIGGCSNCHSEVHLLQTDIYLANRTTYYYECPGCRDRVTLKHRGV